MRMVQRGNSARFAFEAGAQIFAFGDVFGQNLDRDGAVEPGVAGFVHLAHAAGAERGENLVRAEFVASVEGHLSESDKFSRSGGGQVLDRGIRKGSWRSRTHEVANR